MKYKSKQLQKEREHERKREREEGKLLHQRSCFPDMRKSVGTKGG